MCYKIHNKMNEVNERIFVSNDWVTVVFMFTIALIVFDKLWNSERFTKLQSLFYSDIYINDFSKATVLITNVFTYTFILINSLVLSLLLFFSISKLSYKQVADSDFKLFGTILSFVFIYIIIRAIVGYLLGVLFEYEKEQQYISFLKTSYLSNFSLLILPLLILLFYSNSLVLFYIAPVLSTLLLLFYYAKIIKFNQKIIFGGLSYFILYLCALEISPLLIFYKVFIN